MSIQLTGESMQKKESNYEFGFFKLENNHDKAIVRFLHENYDDFSRRPVHFVKVPDQKYRVSINCLRADDAPQDVCPFCKNDLDTSIVSKRSKRIYIEFLVYKIVDKNGKVIQDWSAEPRKMVWERERRFDDKVFSLSSRYNPLCDTVFTIERFGEKGSTDTTYDIYPISGTIAEYPFELPEKLYNPDGVQVEDKTADEMDYYIENNYTFPPKEDEQVVRRSDVAQETSRVQPYQPVENVQQNTVTVQQNVQPQVQPQVAEPVQQPTSRRRSI